MLRRPLGRVGLSALAVVAVISTGNAFGAAPGVAPTACDTPAGDPDPAADANGYQARDQQNQICALQRMEDEYTNPAAERYFWTQKTPGTFSQNLLEQAAEPTRPRGTLEQWVVGGRTTDPYRVAE